MTVEHVEFLVEEPSMEAALRVLLPRVLSPVSFAIYPSQCKHELLKRLPERLRGYASWLPNSWRIVVLLDRDDDNCVRLRTRVDLMAEEAGLRVRKDASRRWQVVNRLAIEELEAWYFGDWQAVRAAYARVPESTPRKKRFRNPDAIRGGTWEALEQVLRRAGYFRAGLRKIEAARTIAEHMDLDRNSSSSFRAFGAVLREITGTRR